MHKSPIAPPPQTPCDRPLKPTAQAALACRHFGFSFAGAPVLKDISFSLQSGGYLSVVGPNGAGKSTLLKSILRLHETGTQSGEIRVMGRPLASYSQRELACRIAYVPQPGDRVPPFTVLEYLRLSRYPYATGRKTLNRKDREAMDRAMALTDTSRYAGRRLSALSGGERQRASLAAALAQEAEILLLDEPTSFLDPRHTAEVNALLKMLNRDQGLTMLTVTHDLNHPLDAGGHVLVLRPGEQLFFGPLEDLVAGDVLEPAFDLSFTYITHPGTGQRMILPDRIERGAA